MTAEGRLRAAATLSVCAGLASFVGLALPWISSSGLGCRIIVNQPGYSLSGFDVLDGHATIRFAGAAWVVVLGGGVLVALGILSLLFRPDVTSSRAVVALMVVSSVLVGVAGIVATWPLRVVVSNVECVGLVHHGPGQWMCIAASAIGSAGSVVLAPASRSSGDDRENAHASSPRPASPVASGERR